MVYQRRMPHRDLFCAQLELLMQSGRSTMVVTHMVGVAVAAFLLWPYLGWIATGLGACAFLALLLMRVAHMRKALRERRFESAPGRLFWALLMGAALTGALWAALFITAATVVPVAIQYVLLLTIISIAAFSIGFSVIVREYFLAQVFTSLWPIAWWNAAHYWQQSYNLVIGLALLAFCAILVLVCNQAYAAFRNMIALNWEREQTARELGDITGSLRLRNRELQNARQQLSNLANVDELTGLGNRRLANSVLQEEMNRARRNHTEISIILLDVDFFKDYNDTYGHLAGDVVLKTLGRLMERACGRAGEVVARYGGEEFLLILPGASSAAAQHTAARLQELVQQEGIAHCSSSAADHLTVSQGVVTARPTAELQPEDLILAADAMLYRAKARGRNAIVVKTQQAG